MIFTKKINILEKKIVITIACNHQTYHSEERFVFKEDISEMIPEQYKGKVKLTKWPEKKISNINRNKYTNTGTWEFEIIPDKKPAPRKPRRTTSKIKSAKE